MNNSISLELLQILDSIDRLGSFAAAAEELHKVRSALTYLIRKFEKYTGIMLYDRSAHRAVLTAAGKYLLQEGRQLLNKVGNLENECKQIANGWESSASIVIDDVLSPEPLFKLLKNFSLSCPHVHLKIKTECLDGCLDALLHERADIAIGLSGILPSSTEFNIQPIANIKFVFAVSKDHPLAKIKKPLSDQQILQFPAIVVADSSLHQVRRTTGLLAAQQRFTFSSMQMKIKAQIAGLGVGYIPNNLILTELKKGLLVQKNVVTPKLSGQFYFVWRKKKQGKAFHWLIAELSKLAF